MDVLVHVVVHLGLTVPHAGVVPIDGGVVAALDGGTLAGAAVDLPAIVGEVGNLGSARAVAVAGGGDSTDFLRPDGGLGAGDDTVESREDHGPTEVSDEDSSDLELGHVLEGGGGGVGVLGGHREVPFVRRLLPFDTYRITRHGQVIYINRAIHIIFTNPHISLIRRPIPFPSPPELPA